MGQIPRFPPGFVWGAATAAYQVEGAVHEDGRGESVWDRFSHAPGRVANGDTGDVACDHYHRYPEDVALMAELGVDAYRFSIAWPRIQPDGRGPANERGLDFYRRLLDELAAHGIRASATLFHWDLPQALEDAGGWMSRDTADRFADYASIVGRALGDRMDWWATLNEPFCHWAEGYGMGISAPGRALLFGSFPAAHHLLLGHGLAVRALRVAGVRGGLGIVNHQTVVVPASVAPEDAAAADAYRLIHLGLFNDPVLGGGYPPGLAAAFPSADLGVVRAGDEAIIASPIDWFGVNYYNPEAVRAAPDAPLGFDWADIDGVDHTGFGWPIVPDGLRDVLVGLASTYGAVLPPVHVTENGAAFPDAVDEHGEVDDPDRVAFLDGHVRALAAAIDAGVDVRGYYVWSLLDNFEWAAGYGQRFGLVYVDYPTQRRIPKASFRWYRDMIGAQR